MFYFDLVIPDLIYKKYYKKSIINNSQKSGLFIFIIIYLYKLDLGKFMLPQNVKEIQYGF